MISIQEQDHELTITTDLSIKCSPSWLLCTGFSAGFLGVNRHLSVHLFKSRSVSIVDRMYFFTFLTLLNQISPVVVYTGTVRRMMSTVAMLGGRSSFVQSSVFCRFFCLPPRQAPNSLSTVRARCWRPLYQSEVRRWSKRFILLCTKNSHSLCVLCSIAKRDYLVLLLTISKQLLAGFRLGHFLSLSENYGCTTVKTKGQKKKTPVGCSELRKQNCLKVLNQSLFCDWGTIY